MLTDETCSDFWRSSFFNASSDGFEGPISHSVPSDTEATHSSVLTSAALNNGTTHPIHAVPDCGTGYPGLSVGAATGIAVGITCTPFGLAAAVCHLKANRRRAAKAKAATANETEENIYKYEFGKADFCGYS